MINLGVTLKAKKLKPVNHANLHSEYSNRSRNGAADVQDIKKPLRPVETHNIHEQSVRVDFDSSDEEKSEDHYINYMKTCKEKGILPKAYGINSRTKSKPKHFKLNNASMGDQYAEAFSQILPFKNSGYTLSLSNNRLSQKGVDFIFEKMNSNIRKLDISNNPHVKHINTHKLITDYNTKLTALNVEGNQTGDNLVVKLAEAIIVRPILKILNLSENLITNKGAIVIAEMLKENNSLIVLQLRWNYIKSKGGVALCNAIKQNSTLMIFEISFNPLGENKKAPKRVLGEDSQDPNLMSDPILQKGPQRSYHNIDIAMSRMFANNKTLMHADFSHTGFNLYECEVMHEGLKENHSLLGLHFMGNPMNVDALGFLKVAEVDIAPTHLHNRMLPSMRSGHESLQKIKLQSLSKCWICEGWTQVEFKLNPKYVNNPPKHEMTPKDHVYINLSIDKFEPDAMTFNPHNGTYTSIRMCPAIEIEYFFTINGQQKYIMNIDKQAPSDTNIDLVFVNVIQHNVKNKKKLNHTYLQNLECLPRPIRPAWPVDDTNKEPEWDITKSVFWGYVPDSSDIIRK